MEKKSPRKNGEAETASRWKLAAVLAVGILVCLMLAACGEETPPPPDPDLVRKKIAEHTGGAMQAEPATAAVTASSTPSAMTPGGGISGPLAMAEETDEGEGAQEMGQAVISREYNPLGKINPFEPLIQDTPTEGAADKGEGGSIPVPTRPRGPLEQYDLTQLTLVGIIHSSDRSLALVQVPSGRGYVVKEGTRIGNRSGKVIQIGKDAVVVEELVEDFLKNVKKSVHELKLQKTAGAGEG